MLVNKTTNESLLRYLDNDTAEVYDEVSERLYRHILIPVERGPTAFLHSGDRKWECGMTGPPGSADGSSSQSQTLILSQIEIKRWCTVQLQLQLLRKYQML